MRFRNYGLMFAFPLLAFAASPAVAADGQSARPEVTAALAAIREDADAVASGKLRGKGALQGPARDIAVRWSKVAPILATDGNVLVETKMANASVTAFEKDWQTKSDMRSEAKDLSDNIGDLVDAEHSKN